MVFLRQSLRPFVATALAGTSVAVAGLLPPQAPDALVGRSAHGAPAPAAEELHVAPGTGNLVWSDDEDASAVPSLGRPDFSSTFEHFGGALTEAEDALKDFFEHLKDDIRHEVNSAVDSALQTARVVVNGQEFHRLTHPDFPSYALRVSTASNATSCDPNVKQYSGYLDISETKHLWFVFFEARNKPEKAPLSLWLNGGPGCSSSTGLLFELGPCRIANEGAGVVHNPHSWTNNANMIFLDQPVNVGYSYSDNGDDVNNTPAAAEDVYAFLQLFLQKYTQYAEKPFIISGESYGGTYIPRMASVINEKNKELTKDASRVHINLESIAIGNGLTEPKTQFASIPEFACSTENEYAIFKNGSSTCLSLEQKAKTCESLTESCYKYNNRLTCLPASLYCWSNLYGPAQQSGLNLYDVRRKCDREKDGPLCYREMEWIETYMNKPDVRKAWGADNDVNFESCNTDVNKAFLFQGDGMHDNSAVIPQLLKDGIRVLTYSGVADFMVNWYGSKRWVEDLDSVYSDEYRKAEFEEWKVDGKRAGRVQKAGKGAGNYAFVAVDAAGHMVPQDQPEAALDMWERWIANRELA